MDNNELFKGKVVSMAIEDALSGLAEIVEYGEKTIKVLWLDASPCYKCASYPKEIYTEVSEYKLEEVYSIQYHASWDKAKRDSIREDSLKNDRAVQRN